MYLLSFELDFPVLLSNITTDGAVGYGINTLPSLRIGAGNESAKRPTPRLYRLPAGYCSGPDQEAPRSEDERQTVSITA